MVTVTKTILLVLVVWLAPYYSGHITDCCTVVPVTSHADLRSLPLNPATWGALFPRGMRVTKHMVASSFVLKYPSTSLYPQAYGLHLVHFLHNKREEILVNRDSHWNFSYLFGKNTLTCCWGCMRGGGGKESQKTDQLMWEVLNILLRKADSANWKSPMLLHSGISEYFSL